MAGEIFVGSVAVGVVPDARGIEDKMRKQVVPAAEKIGDEAGTEMGKALTTRMGWAGEDAGDEFGKRFKEHLRSALANLPKVNLDGDTSEIDLKLEEIRRKIEEINNQDLIDATKAYVDLTEISAELTHIKEKANDIPLTFKTEKVKADITAAVATAVDKGTQKGITSGVHKAIPDVEAAVQTGAGAVGAGSSVLGNIMSLLGGGKGGRGGGGGGIANIAKDVSSGGGGGGGGILGGIGGMLGGIPLIGGLISGPQAVVTLPAIAGVVALIGQQVAGAVVGVLGGALAAMGIGGAFASGKLAEPLKILTKSFHDFFLTIGTPMIGVMASVLDTISKTITILTPVFKAAQQIIGGPLQKFLDAIVKSFGLPSVATSIDAVARAFAAILDAITPTIAPNMDKLAIAITNIADKITSNPQAIADFFSLVTNFITFILNALGKLTDLATKLEQEWPWVAKALGIKAAPPAPPAGAINQFVAGAAQPGTPGIPAIPAIKGRAAVPAHAAVYDKYGHLIHPATAAIPGIAAVPGVAGTPAWAGYQPIRNIGVPNAWASVVQGPPGAWQPGYKERLGLVPGPYAAVQPEPASKVAKENAFVRAVNPPLTSAANALAWVTMNAGGGIWDAIKSPFMSQSHQTGNVSLLGMLTNQIRDIISNPLDPGKKPDTKKTTNQTGADIVTGITQGAADQVKKSGPLIGKQITEPYLQHINSPQGFDTHSPSKKTIPIGKDLIGGIMQGMQIAVGGLAPWIATWVVAPVITALVGDTYGFSMSNAGTTVGMQPSQRTVPIGWAIIDGIKEGITEEMIGMDSWVTTAIVNPIITYLTSPTGFHIASPAKKMVPIGKQIVTGVIQGMMDEGGHIGKFVAKVFGGWPQAILSFVQKGLDPTKLNPAAQKLFQQIIGGVGTAPLKGGKSIPHNITAAWHNVIGSAGGVARWAGTVSKALTMLGLPQSLSGQVLYQMQTESGGNPNAINLTDSNAKRGDPSRGLLQTIGATFAQYHVAGTSMNIYDPLANIAAAINYAVHRYGSTLMNSSGQGMGSGHGYDTGGWLPPGVTLAYNYTGRPERVLSPGEWDNLQAGGTQYHAHFDGLTGAAIESHVLTAFQTMSLTQGNLQRQGRRS